MAISKKKQLEDLTARLLNLDPNIIIKNQNLHLPKNLFILKCPYLKFVYVQNAVQTTVTSRHVKNILLTSISYSALIKPLMPSGSVCRTTIMIKVIMKAISS